jgi:hypothetical protein
MKNFFTIGAIFAGLCSLFIQPSYAPVGPIPIKIDGQEAPLSETSTTHPEDFAAAVRKGAAFRLARRKTWIRESHDPIQRTRLLTQFTKELCPELKDVTTVITADGIPQYKGIAYPNIHASNWNNTLLLHNKVSLGRADYIVLLVPGQVATYSHAGSWLPFLNQFEKFSDFKVYAETFDQPFHGAGPDDERYLNLDYAARNLFLKRIGELRKRNKPIVVITRSNGYLPILRALQYSPSSITSLLLTSPPFPDKKLIARSDLEDVIQISKPVDKRWTVNIEGWRLSSHWENTAINLFHGPIPKPRSGTVEVWFGASDEFVPEEEKQLWKNWVGEKNVLEIDKGKHDLFVVGNPKEIERTKNRVNDVGCLVRLGELALIQQRNFELEVHRLVRRLRF